MACKFVTYKVHISLNNALATKKVIFAYDKNKRNGAKIYHSVECEKEKKERQQFETEQRQQQQRNGETAMCSVYVPHTCNVKALAAGMSRSFGNRYEIMFHGKTIRLFFDIEWLRTASVADNMENNGVATLRRLLDELLPEFMGYKAEYIVIDSCRPKKISYHVVFPNVICSTVRDHLKAFAVLFVAWLGENYADDETLFYTNKRTGMLMSIIDLCVYRHHGLFRMQNQHKMSDQTRTPLKLCAELSKFAKPTPHDCLLQVLDAARMTDVSNKIDGQYIEQIKRKCNYKNMQVFFKRGYPVNTVGLVPPSSSSSSSAELLEQQRQQPNDMLQIRRYGKGDNIYYRVEWVQAETKMVLSANHQFRKFFDAKMLRGMNYMELYMQVLCDMLQYYCGREGERDGGVECVIGWMKHTERQTALDKIESVTKDNYARIYGKPDTYFSFASRQLRLKFKYVVDMRHNFERAPRDWDVGLHFIQIGRVSDYDKYQQCIEHATVAAAAAAKAKEKIHETKATHVDANDEIETENRPQQQKPRKRMKAKRRRQQQQQAATATAAAASTSATVATTKAETTFIPDVAFPHIVCLATTEDALAYARKKKIAAPKSARSFYPVTGKMSAGKTKAVLAIAETKLVTEKIETVVCCTPRRSLAEELEGRFRGLIVEDKSHHKTGVIYTETVYGRSEEDEEEYYRKKREGTSDSSNINDNISIGNEYDSGGSGSSSSTNPAQPQRQQHKNITEDLSKATGYFYSVCTNSIVKLNVVKTDILIIDEGVMTANATMNMNGRMMLNRNPPDSTLVRDACATDTAMLERLVEMIRNTRVLFVIDANFKPSVLQFYHDLFYSTHEIPNSLATLENLEKGQGRKEFRNFFQNTARNNTVPLRYTVREVSLVNCAALYTFVRFFIQLCASNSFRLYQKVKQQIYIMT